MKRRGFLAAAAGCGACLASRLALGQSAWQTPARFARPDIATDEGGLWALMDREETRLRRSPFALKDASLHGYVQEIACRLAGDHCPDVRVHLVRTPQFNASMAPNGMMQVWTGLMLRADNEAQLAAVIGHEIGHYLARHSLERLRDVKAKAAFGQFLGLFGIVGAVGQMGLVASMFAYSRDHERQADEIGARLMRKAGYDVGEAAKVWDNLLLEIEAARAENPAAASPMFATHPPAEERRTALQALAGELPGGETGEAAWRERTRPFLRDWLHEEVKRGQHEESLALLGRMARRSPREADFLAARGDVYRMRAKGTDHDAALEDYASAVRLGGEPAETHRGMGMIHRLRSRPEQARSSFQKYIEMAPDAADAAMIRSYIEELKT